MNEKLRNARNDRRWSIDEAAGRIGISRTTYIRWEHNEQNPHGSTLNMVCDAFKMTPEQLGFRVPVNTSVRISSVSTSAVELLSEALGSTAPDMLSIGVLALSLAQKQYHWTAKELRAKTEMEMRRLEMEQRKHKDGDISRRHVLHFLASLPVAFLGFSQINSKTALPTEEVLSLYSSSVPACWRLFFEGELAEVENVLPTYLSHLTPLAQQSSKYQKYAASLTSQTHQLASLNCAGA
jgi:transcriptional regulator with XRE-family HTH domain